MRLMSFWPSDQSQSLEETVGLFQVWQRDNVIHRKAVFLLLIVIPNCTILWQPFPTLIHVLGQ